MSVELRDLKWAQFGSSGLGDRSVHGADGLSAGSKTGCRGAPTVGGGSCSRSWSRSLHGSIEEVAINWSKSIRQTHRWLSIVFTITAIANFVAMGLGRPPAWVVYSPLPPLYLQLVTGLYLFVLPHAAKRRSVRGGGGSE